MVEYPGKHGASRYSGPFPPYTKAAQQRNALVKSSRDRMRRDEILIYRADTHWSLHPEN